MPLDGDVSISVDGVPIVLLTQPPERMLIEESGGEAICVQGDMGSEDDIKVSEAGQRRAAPRAGGKGAG